MVALDNRISRQGWKGGKDSFHAAHRAVAASVEVGEEQPFLCREPIHFRREAVGVAQTAPEFGAEALFEEDDDIQPRAGGLAAHPPANRLALRHELGVGFLQQTTHPLVGFGSGQGLIKGGVIEVARPGGRHKGKAPVIGQFVDGPILAHMGSLEIEGGSQAKCQGGRPEEVKQACAGRKRSLPHRGKEPGGRPRPPQLRPRQTSNTTPT